MSLRDAVVRPPRCVLVNVHTAESFECLLNPAQLSEKVQVNYARLAIPGLPYQLLQYQGTGNRQLGGVEFYLNRFFAAEQPGDPDIMEFRAFLRALTVPPEAVGGVLQAAPPRTLIIWPEILTVEAVLTSVEFQYRQIDTGGRVLVYTASISFEEILDTRLTSEALRRDV